MQRREWKTDLKKCEGGDTKSLFRIFVNFIQNDDLVIC